MEIVIQTQEITPRQARLILHQYGLLDQVNTIISSQPIDVQIEWEYATTISLNSDMVQSILTGLGLTPIEIFTMFQEASTL